MELHVNSLHCTIFSQNIHKTLPPPFLVRENLWVHQVYLMLLHHCHPNVGLYLCCITSFWPPFNHGLISVTISLLVKKWIKNGGPVYMFNLFYVPES